MSSRSSGARPADTGVRAGRRTPMPRRPAALLLGFAATMLLAACAGASTPGQSPTVSLPPDASATTAGASPAPSASAATTVPASPVVGVVLKVDSAGLDKVSGFTLRTNDGQTIALAIGVLENGAQFPPGHLAEHLATAAPVRVWFRDENGTLVVYRIEDAS